MAELTQKERERRDRIAQWAFDTRPILSRLHLWLEDVQVDWLRGCDSRADEFAGTSSFMDGRMERLMAITAAATATGTFLYGRYGEGAGLSKAELNRVKKDADAVSAYVMSECLWHASRQLPENHAIMVCLGEGLMPKSGETVEMGSNPQLGFGRVYARAQIAEWLDNHVTRLLNDASYEFEDFYRDVKTAGITVWGAAIDTLENTSRFAKGEPTGPMTVLHLFDQPLLISRPYEGYMGNLFLPRAVVERAAKSSVLLDYRTPRAKVVEAIELTYPGIAREEIHVWTLRGKGRIPRIGGLWDEWEALGVHLVDDRWELPSSIEAFTESGTYAPTYLVGTWQEDGRTHVFLCDGYAASAEAMQAASLAPLKDLHASLAVFSSRFKLPHTVEQQVMHLDPEALDFPNRLAELIGERVDDATADDYKRMIREARDAGLPLDKPVLNADDFFPEKNWDVLALAGHMCPDPYTGARGVEEIAENVYKTSIRLSTPHCEKLITLTLRLMERPDVGRLVFNPLLVRFFYGEDYSIRAVKISDSGRIRNELQTLCSEALEYLESRKIRLHFDRIPPEVISQENQAVLLEVLRWYKQHHPIWFAWLEIAPPGSDAPAS
jgi:hypothetical protein